MKHFDSKILHIKTPIEIFKFKNEDDFKLYKNGLDEEKFNEFELDLSSSNSNKRSFLNKNYKDEINNELFKKQGLIVILISIILLVYTLFTIKSLFFEFDKINWVTIFNCIVFLAGIYFTTFSVALIKNKLLKISKNFILDGNKIIVTGPFNLTLIKFYPKNVSLHSLSKSGSYILKFSDNTNRVILAIPMTDDVFGPTNYYKEFYDSIIVNFQTL